MAATSAALFTARALIDEMVRGGVAAACVAPGSRSTPLALALAERSDIDSRVMTDERSMAFFALGLARRSGKPVVLVCTSGTAAANFLPAVAEASLGGGALVLLTADRPPELRDCAAPQTIDQVGLFGSHARWAVDVPLLEVGEGAARVLRSIASRAVATSTEGGGGPVHLNVPFREPFFDDCFPSATTFDLAGRRDGRPFTEVLREADAGATWVDPALRGNRIEPAFRSDGVDPAFRSDGIEPAFHRDSRLRSVAARLAAAERGVIVCAGLEIAPAEVAALAAALGWPILADPLCGLRFGGHDRSAVIDAHEALLRDDTLRASLKPDAIVRFGLTPAPRAMQRWLEEAWPAEHVVVAEHGWPDPMRTASVVVRSEPGAFCRALVAALAGRQPNNATLASRERWISLAAAARTALDAGLDDTATLFDGVVLRSVVAALPDGATLLVGNSMPVRDADAFLASSPKRLRVFANRGASGIDGVVSTALGMAAANASPTALVVGDLSFLHDAGALAFAVRERIPLLVVVVNNDGGGIFSYLPQRGLGDDFERFFATPHGSDLAKVAAVVDGRFARVTTKTELEGVLRDALAACSDGPFVVEVRSDREAGRAAQLEIVASAQRAAGACSIASTADATQSARLNSNLPRRTE